MITPKKDKEYLFIDINKIKSRLICTKVFKDTKGKIERVTFTNPLIENSSYEYTMEELKVFTIYEPIDNTEFFSMYINWNNFYKPGVHQNLNSAYEIYLSILESLKQRSYVRFGTGAFVEYDYRLKDKLFNTYCE